MSKYITFKTANESVRVKPADIVYFSSDGNYTTMVLCNKTEHLFLMNLRTVLEEIVKQLKLDSSTFIRIGKSLIINREYIYIINISKQRLSMLERLHFNVFELNASKEALKELKQFIDNDNKE